MTTPTDRLTGETVELLQALIQKQCVNDGTAESGQEVRSVDLLVGELEGPEVDLRVFEPTPGRGSLIARYPGTDPDAPALCLMGHTDVVPVSPDGWDVDPFAGERMQSPDGVDEVWGRGAVDMLNLTASMAVAFREIVRSGKRYPGDIVYFAVADEEQGGLHGAGHLVENEWEALHCDFVLTEYGGSPMISDDGTIILMTTAEKGGDPRRIIVHGEPGHGSMPYRADSALVKSAEIVRRLTEYTPEARLDEMFAARVKAMGLSEDSEQRLLDPARLHDALAELPFGLARSLHSCAHTSFSPNVLTSGGKNNVIPDRAELVVDIRTLHGVTPEDVDGYLADALGEDLMGSVEIEPLFPNMEAFAPEPSSSPTGTAVWNALVEAVSVAYPGASVLPSLVTVGTDARFFRRRGVPSYGAGLLSPQVPMAEFLNRFHGHNERIDVESLRLTTRLWLDVCDRLWV
ncbi:MAG: M20/M25/M40 family metallo-hydrolase [Acidimicrobiia bacterium]|nr:M20/M25/M40 family metallo-hydrolase [Acidimicrobiia bacterium]